MAKIPKVFVDWTVLVVDDEPDNLEVVKRLLNKSGATSITAEDGEEALQVLEETRPHFILCDLSMPGMDGWQFFQALRDIPKIADIPVFALTAHAMLGDRERILRVGFKHYISKPIDPFTFIQELHEVMHTIPSLAELLTDELPT